MKSWKKSKKVLEQEKAAHNRNETNWMIIMYSGKYGPIRDYLINSKNDVEELNFNRIKY
jgi:uncharacterized protein YgiM (DUF1202 family)